jgi:putative transposase
VRELCQALEVAESGYYAWCKNGGLSGHAKRDKALSEQILEIHKRSKGRYGAPRIHKKLVAQGENCSLKRVARLIRELGIRGKGKKKFKPNTTDSKHNLPIAPNLLEQNFQCNAPDQIYTADITYIPTLEGWLYLAVVIDLFSRKVIGWAMDEQMPRHLVMKALTMAYWRRKPPLGVIHHSDRGSQYASHDFQALLKSYGMICSMSGKGNCYDNAVTESLFHTLKVELVHDAKFKTREEARAAIFEYFEVFYNRERIHSTLGYCTPEEFEENYMAKVA